MPYLLAGVLALVAILFLMRGAKDADPHKLGDGLRIGAIMGLGLIGLFMLVTGRVAFAVPLVAAAVAFTRRRIFNKVLASVLGAVLSDKPKPQGGAQRSEREQSSHANADPNVYEVMTRARALEILGLPETASADDIKAAHRRLMQHVHPDHGGDDEKAALLNAAKDFLLDR